MVFRTAGVTIRLVSAVKRRMRVIPRFIEGLHGAGIVGIVFGSCFKGILTGLAAGFFARRVHNLAFGILLGLIVGMALSYGVAAMQGKYYFEIMLPGSILGAIVGFATQRLPKTAS